MSGAPSATDPKCVFCQIVAGKSPAHIFYEDEGNVGFLDLFPFTRGHLLVVPKRHVPRLTDLPESDYASYLGALATICRRVERLSSDYNIALNQGSKAGQVVFHLHFHVIPRYDAGNPFHGRPRERLTEGAARELKAILNPP